MKGVKRLVINGLVMIGLFSQVSSVWAFWEAGHMMVANIAYHHLNSKARFAVDNLLKQFYIENTSTHDYSFDIKHPIYTMMAVSVWPDDMKGTPNFSKMHGAWHYIEDAFSLDGTKTPSIKYAHSIVWAIKQLQADVGRIEANPYDRARSFAYLIHLVGDIHQPLHCGELYSIQFPNGDLGGNKYDIVYEEPNGTVLTNLHALWDSAIALLPNKGYPYDENTPIAIDSVSKAIMIDYPISELGDRVTRLDINAWEKESHELAITAHHTSYAGRPSAAYIYENTRIIEKQIALSGYRLAFLLNALLGDKNLK